MNKFLEALEAVGPSPCEKYECTRMDLCAQERVDCKAFRFWVNNGTFEKYSKKANGMIDLSKDVGRLIYALEV